MFGVKQEMVVIFQKEQFVSWTGRGFEEFGLLSQRSSLEKKEFDLF